MNEPMSDYQAEILLGPEYKPGYEYFLMSDMCDATIVAKHKLTGEEIDIELDHTMDLDYDKIDLPPIEAEQVKPCRIWWYVNLSFVTVAVLIFLITLAVGR